MNTYSILKSILKVDAVNNLWSVIRLDKRLAVVKNVLKVMTEDDIHSIVNRHNARAWVKMQSPRPYEPTKDLLWRISYNRECGEDYRKVVIEGNKHLYWASPVYGHADYNKRIFAANTPRNRVRMAAINILINK